MKDEDRAPLILFWVSTSIGLCAVAVTLTMVFMYGL